MSDFVLSTDQLRAVECDAPAIVVVAGAGSGKTEVLARRVERLLSASEDEGYRVLAVSYTVKAADELRERLATRLGDVHRRVDADTIHGFAHSLIRQHGTRIGLPPEPELLTRNEDRVELLDGWLAQSGKERPLDLSQVLADLDLARAQCRPAPYLKEWADALDAAGAIDFGAMLDRAAELAEGAWLSRHLRRIYSHVVVDEAQNLTPAQYGFLTNVIGGPTDAFIHSMLVGDERQSIVGFAGADSGLIRRFEDEYVAERIELHTNYRSARAIVDAGRSVATALGQPDQLGTDSDYSASGKVMVWSFPTEAEEGDAIAGWIATLLEEGLPGEALTPGEHGAVEAEDIAVLGRSAATLRVSRDSLAARGIATASASTPEEWVKSPSARVIVELIAYNSAPGHVSTRRRIAELCGQDGTGWEDLGTVLGQAEDPNIALLASVAAPDSPEQLVGLISEMDVDDPDWDGDVLQFRDAWNSFIDRTNGIDRTFGNLRVHIARTQRGDSLDPGVRLLTVHKAQGREFKAIAVVGCNEGQFPDFRATDSEAQAAELRTFYVAITRPSRLLLLTRALQRDTRFGPRATEQSTFLSLLG